MLQISIELETTPFYQNIENIVPSSPILFTSTFFYFLKDKESANLPLFCLLRYIQTQMDPISTPFYIMVDNTTVFCSTV